jgi:hypothetical protein
LKELAIGFGKKRSRTEKRQQAGKCHENATNENSGQKRKSRTESERNELTHRLIQSGEAATERK